MPAYLIMLFLCEALLLVLCCYIIFSWIARTPFYPSNLRSLNNLYKKGRIKLPQDTKFIDLGSGDGRIVVWAAKNGAQAEGIEFNPYLSLFSRVNILLRGQLGKANILNKDFTRHDYSKYNVVYMYIFPRYMNMVKEKLFNELPKGAMIISNTFQIEGYVEDEKVDRFYIYYVK